MKTTAYTVRALAQGVFEIGEFDCGSMFLIEGDEKALLIDCGTGIGDLRAALSRLTDKPLIVALTHNHPDHIGHLPLFGEAYINEADMDGAKDAAANGRQNRAGYAGFIAQRSGLSYPYNLDVDMEGDWDISRVKFLPLRDGMCFELGGRAVTTYLCPGHTPGSAVFIDGKSRIMFLGDALNGNLLIMGSTIEKALEGLQRIRSQNSEYDVFYNGHYDFRLCGKPLDTAVLTDTIEAMRKLMGGDYELTFIKSDLPIFPDREVMKLGKAMITFDKERIRG